MSAPDRRARLGVWLVVVIAAAALAAFLVLRGSSRSSGTTRPQAAAPPPAHGATHEPPDLRAGLEPVVPDGVSPEEERAEFNRVMAESYRQNVRGVEHKIAYPLWSRPLTDEDRWRPPEPHLQEQHGPLDVAHVLSIWPARMSFDADDPITVYAVVTDDGKAVAPTTIAGWIDTAGWRNRPDLTIGFRDDGIAPDQRKGDLLYTANIDLDEATRRKHVGDWGFRVKVTLGDEPIETMNAFHLWPTDVTLTGAYRDEVVDGSLIVHVGVHARQARELFQVRAELHGPGGEDIGFAWVNQALPAGASEMQLVFWGKVIHDRGIDGPYRIVHVTMVDPIADMRAPTATGVAHVTAAYRATQFRGDAFHAGNAMLAEKLAGYRGMAEQAERGELELPDEPAVPVASGAP